ncbi:hypothetical protein ACJX0J_042442, partial [Zea mays]
IFIDVSGIYLEVDRENLLACATSISSFIGIESGEKKIQNIISLEAMWKNSKTKKFTLAYASQCLKIKIEYSGWKIFSVFFILVNT